MGRVRNTEEDFRQQSSSTTPGAGLVRLFAKTDARLYHRDPSGVEVQIAKNVFVQQSNPGMTSPGMWWETDGSGALITLWVETS